MGDKNGRPFISPLRVPLMTNRPTAFFLRSEQQPAEIRPTGIEVAWPVTAGLGWAKRAGVVQNYPHWPGPPKKGARQGEDQRGESRPTSMWKTGFIKGCQLRCRPRHLTEVQNYEVRLKYPSPCFKTGR
ncbi:hypothetical protein AVEN_170847-1 [Araneus ventricosus]|uniref:Uncharacterized protein n=1 Tax=Araneus ventricosus TaxID=182803 RepID=A0A4Y2GLH4_ARAVE|nr:hypothetical protein AVEN_45568-1 [Araneus ventricosus]GBM54446.1 hypothetical protein AVEN_77292-1 [Araneus ventricosus]GBM54460.1 hypothetical protein AVEN_124735-1 [Araneus ventricosus]GBM54489.1 hypothetical protein AVEN_170847-1 [Araneus ventricosus]